ncbi:HBS1-like protein isoform X3 [Dendrobium catenatum]|uniref:HBS1-like protein isoform X3 n=1 Tax=Dendrobium catenatum TaxID=906689 RepID=UPI00109FF4FD|nr:HBS1-like protein isoform X3 [Dendrobium catenatum]
MMGGVTDKVHNYFDGDQSMRGILSEQKKSASKHGFWRCLVCTYENDGSLSSCYICGVFKDSFDGWINKALGICEHSTSVMAKALFAGMPHQGTVISSLSDAFLRKDDLSSETRSTESLNNVQETLPASISKHSITIVPFRFDTLSPDDIVSLGRKKTKDHLATAIPATISSSSTDEKEVVKILAEHDDPETSSALSSHLNGNRSNNLGINDNESEILVSKIHHLKLDKKIKNIKKVMSPSQYKPEKWILSEQQQETKSQLNIAIVGHVDSGKSTLCGRLLHLLGKISKKEIHKYQKEAKEKGKGSFAFAWAMDETAEERERGITMTVAIAYFESKKYRVVLLDSPGHKDFVSNMISGSTQADAAILLVDASKGSFEAGMGFHDVGQTKEHAQLIRSFGVEQIVVAVNKMDTVGYSQERFNYIKSQLAAFLRSCGFKETLITWIPLSAMDNQNVVTSASNDHLSWYHGLCLLDAIDSLYPPERDVLKPLLMPVCDVVSSHSLGQVAACGKLEAGAIRHGSKVPLGPFISILLMIFCCDSLNYVQVLIMPSGDLATIRSIERDCQACLSARAGDNVAVSLQGTDVSNLVPSAVICHPDFPVTVADILELKILVLDVKMPILLGSHVEFHIHHAKEAAQVTKIVSLLDQKKAKTSKIAPRLLTARQSATIEVSLERPVCVEEFSSCRTLGRAFLRCSGITIAVGIVTRIIFADEQ